MPLCSIWSGLTYVVGPKCRQSRVAQPSGIALTILDGFYDALRNHPVYDFWLARIVKVFASTVECFAHDLGSSVNDALAQRLHRLKWQ